MEEIKVSHINPTDIKGGASLAGYRLHKDFLKYPEIDSVLFVHKKHTRDKEVLQFSNFFFRQIERVLNKIGYLTGLQYLFSVNWLSLFFRKRFYQTDVFIIRMLHGGYLPFWLPWLLSKIAPVIWRFPDMWAFTGHCSYSYDCQKFKEVCRECPRLSDYPGLLRDTTSFLFRLKKFFYQKSNLYIVSPSKWLLGNIKQSPIFKNAQAFRIPTGVDTAIFKPERKNKRPTVIAVSAASQNKRKGGELFPKILSSLNKVLKEKNLSLDFYWVGEKTLSFPSFSSINHIFLGFLHERELAEYYARAHLHILPTLADNLPNTLLESLASGTPAVTFDVGGCKDVIKHLKTGYLAKPRDIDDFIRGIISLLDNQQRLTEMGKEGRKLIVENFTLQHQTQRYLKLIENILNL